MARDRETGTYLSVHRNGAGKVARMPPSKNGPVVVSSNRPNDLALKIALEIAGDDLSRLWIREPNSITVYNTAELRLAAQNAPPRRKTRAKKGNRNGQG